MFSDCEKCTHCSRWYRAFESYCEYIEEMVLSDPNDPDHEEYTKNEKLIELIGRVCYKSEDKITDDSYEKFLILPGRNYFSFRKQGIVKMSINIPFLLQYDKCLFICVILSE